MNTYRFPFVNVILTYYDQKSSAQNIKASRYCLDELELLYTPINVIHRLNTTFILHANQNHPVVAFL